MTKKNLLFFLLLVLAFVSIAVFSQNNELVTRYLTAANNQYSEGNYSKAFDYINVVLSSFGNENIPQNVEALSETIYFGYLESLKTSRDWEVFDQIKEKLMVFTFLSSDRISRSVKVLNSYIDDEIAEKESAQKQESNILELQLALEKIRQETTEASKKASEEQQQELLKIQKEKDQVYEKLIQDLERKSNDDNRLFIFVLIAIGGITIVIFASIIINVLISLKNYKDQNEKFTETLRAVAEMTQVQAQAQGPMLTALPPVYNKDQDVRYIGSSVSDSTMPPEPTTDRENKELEELALTCRELGSRIDLVTARKNNSKNVAELVYKLSQEMGYSQYESTLFFSVAMVYDIGFLHIDSDLLQLPSLTEEQKQKIRCHVEKGVDALDFVPEKYKPVFKDGVLMHHENMDGSGYPSGIFGEDIPYIARLLRVAETFVSLISKRSYRGIFDKESAVKELKTEPHLYDTTIVEMLESSI